MSDVPLNHVLRPQLPWRRPECALTECGLRADSYPTIGRDDLAAQVKKMGRQRTALLTCMTCLTTAQRWPSWDEDPARCLDREIPRTRLYMGPPALEDPFTLELRALAALVELHRDDFDGLIAGMAEATSLASRRRARR